MPGQLHTFVERRAKQGTLFLKQLLLLLQQGNLLRLQTVKQIDQVVVAREQPALVDVDLSTMSVSNQWRTIKSQALQREPADRCEGIE